MKYLILCFLLFPAIALGLTEEQRENLSLAYSIGAKYQMAETLSALVLTESSLGVSKYGDTGKPLLTRSYGLAQMRPDTAYDVIKAHPWLAEVFFKKSINKITLLEVRRELIHNDSFALFASVLHLKDLKAKCNGNTDCALVSYNAGYNGMKGITNHKEFKYTKTIKANMKIVRKEIAKGGLK